MIGNWDGGMEKAGLASNYVKYPYLPYFSFMHEGGRSTGDPLKKKG